LIFNISAGPSQNRYSEQVTSVYPTAFSVTYSLDDRILGTYSLRIEPLCITENLKGLPEGTHKIEIFATTSSSLFANVPTSRISFTVDSKPPKIESPSLKANSLGFFTDDEVSKVFYSIDGAANMTLSDLIQKTDNKTAIAIVAPFSVKGIIETTGLSEGSHSIIAYATDEAGNVGCSDLVQIMFNNNSSISTPSPSPATSPAQSPSLTIEPSPPNQNIEGAHPISYDFYAIVVILVFIVVGVSLLVQFKKHSP
jgi:hypothetical protein